MRPEHTRGAPWAWVEGIVNTGGERFEITYGDDPRPSALVRRGRGRSITVQLFSPAGESASDAKEAHAKVEEELRFYFVEPNEPDPWAYAIYHCTTAANLYSQVHWHFRHGNYGGPGIGDRL